MLGNSLILLNTSHSLGFLKALVGLGFRVGGELMGIMKEPVAQGRFFDQQIWKNFATLPCFFDNLDLLIQIR